MKYNSTKQVSENELMSVNGGKKARSKQGVKQGQITLVEDIQI